MKRFISIIAVAFAFMLVALPAFAAEANTGCQHVHAFEANTDVTECPDCGAEVYECQECGKVFCVSFQRCPVCRTKRAPITQEEQFDKFIHDKKIYIAERVFLIFAGILLVVITPFVFAASLDEEDYPIFLFGTISFDLVMLGLVVYAIIEIVKTHQIIAPFM